MVVICDRFTASTVAYQGYGRGIALDLIERLNQEATQGVRPDLTIFLDVPVEEGLSRKRGPSRDAFESESAEFHRRVRAGYLLLGRGRGRELARTGRDREERRPRGSESDPRTPHRQVNFHTASGSSVLRCSRTVSSPNCRQLRRQCPASPV